MLELFYSSGLRLSELVGLNLDQLDLAAGLVRVLGKGNKVRELPVGSKAREALQAWLPLRTLAGPADGAVFIGQQGRRLGARAVQLRVRQAGVRELGQHLHPHMLRHSSPAICWNPRRTCARCRSCSAMPTSARRRSTRTWISSTAKVYDHAHPRAKRKQDTDT